MKLRTLATVALSVGLGLALVGFAVPAFAHGAEHDRGNFPMKAEEFQQRVEARIARGNERLEKRIAEKKIDAEKAKELRARAADRAAKVRAAAQQAEADGVVTKEEAREVRAAGGGRRFTHEKK